MSALFTALTGLMLPIERRNVAATVPWIVVVLLVLAAGASSAPSESGDIASITTWDFVVIGAGTGGALCAARLAASGSEVLLVEAGKWDNTDLYKTTARDRNSEPNIWAYPTRLPGRLSVQNSPPFRHRIAGGKIVGGSSMVHGDVYDRPPLKDFEHHLRSWDAATVRAALSRIEDDVGVAWWGTASLDDVPDPQFWVIDKLMNNFPLEHHPEGNLDGKKGGLAVGWTMFRTCDKEEPTKCKRHTSYSALVPQWNGSAGSQGLALDREGGARHRLTVVTGAVAARVLMEGTHAIGVELQRHGQLHEVFARRAVVLAAGAIGTPKILTLSGIGDPYELQRLGIPVRVANREVGYGLADHLAMFTWFMIAGQNFDLEGPLCQDKEWFNIFFNLTDPPTGGDGPVDAEVRFFSGCNLTRKTVDFGVEAVLLHPESRGRVTVTSSDAGVMPIVEFPPLWERDLDRLEAIYTRLAEALEMSPQEFSGNKARTLRETLEADAYLYQHFCCSARAAPDGQPGVCDENLSVRGVRGLFIADASALPFPPSAHSSAAALLVGELAAASAIALRGGQPPLPERAQLAEEQRQEHRALLLAAAPSLVESATSSIPKLRLLGGARGSAETAEAADVDMPMVALGTGNLGGAAVAAVATFLRLGGRHLDTAVMYDNYADLRAGIQAAGLGDSKDVVITWKVMPYGRDYVQKQVAAALQGLGVQRIQIALLHWPGDVTNGKLLHGMPLPACVQVSDGDQGVAHSWQACRQESYAALVEEQTAGRVGAVGISNFAARHVEDVVALGYGVPAVHQTELHPLWHDDDVLVRHAADGTRVQAYGCLGGKHTGAHLLQQKHFNEIAKRHNVTAAQILLRWAVQRGASVITGGSTAAHIADNLRLFHFELTEEDMDFLDSMPPEVMRKAYGPLPNDIL